MPAEARDHRGQEQIRDLPDLRRQWTWENAGKREKGSPHAQV